MKENPIGVFDSGLGGLTILKALREALPAEHFIYLGDTARLPYGSKSPDVIRRYVGRCLQFLDQQRVKKIVIACHTASALGLDSYAKGDRVHGVVVPGARAALAASPNRRILVLATHSTVKSEAYLKQIARLDPEASVLQIACPLLVPLAEEGWFDSTLTEEIIRHYLKDAAHHEADTVLLGCTHYPLLEPAFRKVLGDKVNLVHAGAALAEEVRESLEAHSMVKAGGVGSARFFSTDAVTSSDRVLQALFGYSSPFEVVDL